MAGRTVSFNTNCDLCDSHLEALAKWLSCNGETWGVGPTAVFASAAALFLYNELEATVFAPGDHAHVSLLEKTLISSMVIGMLALMIHIWVCSMRFFQYYLDTLIRDSPNVLLEMTTAGLLGGGQTELVALGPLTRFLKQQQPQIHITLCWFLSLCYADYVRKHYCTRFNMPYLEQWQTELHARAASHVRATMARVHSFVGGVHRRLRGFGPAPATTEAHTVAPRRTNNRVWSSAGRAAVCPGPAGAGEGAGQSYPPRKRCACASSANPARRLRMPLRNSEPILKLPVAPVLATQIRGCAALSTLRPKRETSEELLWRYLATFERAY